MSGTEVQVYSPSTWQVGGGGVQGQPYYIASLKTAWTLRPCVTSQEKQIGGGGHVIS